MKTSVAICTYNGEKYIEQQLDSILDQTVSIDEIVICDDCSTDNTIKIIHNYIEKYSNIIRLNINNENLKSVKNFEKAISLCQNEIIFLADQDDIWIENKVDFIVNYFTQNPNIECVATNGYLINGNSDHYNLVPIWDIFNSIHIKSQEDYLSMITICGNFSTGATMAFKKDKILPFINFPVIKNYHHDEWIAFNFIRSQSFYFINEKLINYRIHTNQQVGSVAIKSKKIKSIAAYFNIHSHDLNFTLIKKRVKNIIKSIKEKPKIYTEINISCSQNLFSNLNEVLIFHNQLIQKKYPLRSFFLKLIDKIKNKRQLNLFIMINHFKIYIYFSFAYKSLLL